MSIGNDKHGWLTIGLVLLVVMAGCAGGGGGGGADGGGADGGGSAPGDARAGPGAGAQSAERASGGSEPGSFYLGEDRIVVREASMAVEVDQFDPAFDRARTIVRDNGGFVADWELKVERGWHVATMVIRVPSENFNDVRDGLAGLGDVERETVQAKDFTARHDDLGSRLDDLRQRESELEALLSEETNDRRARQLQQELADVRESIREVESERASLERRDALSTIELSLQEPEGARQPRNAEVGNNFDAAFLTAFFAGLIVVKYALALVGFAVPVLLLLVGFGTTGVVTTRLARRGWAGFEAALARVGLGPSAAHHGPGVDGGEE